MQREPFEFMQKAPEPVGALFVPLHWRKSNKSLPDMLFEKLTQASSVRSDQLYETEEKYNHPEFKLIAPRPVGVVEIAASR